MKEWIYVAQTAVSAAIAYISAKLGILFPVLCLLAILMVIDYVTGMLAAKQESLNHPDDKNYGWNSKKGAKGIIKKVGYLCIIAVGMAVDFIIMKVAADLGMEISLKAFFGLLVAIWYVLNELLSIVENAGRMGAPVPEWLGKYIAVLKNKIDDKGSQEG